MTCTDGGLKKRMKSKTDRKREAAKGCSANSQLHISTWVTHVISSRRKHYETHAHAHTQKRSVNKEGT